MSTIWEEIRFKVIHSGSRLNLLIGINVGVFLVLGIVYVIETLITKQSTLHDVIYSYLILPSSLSRLPLKFWTPITYMFLEKGILPFVFNMLWFYWIGQIFEEYLGSKKLLTLYILGGLVGAFFYILAYNVFPLFESARAISSVEGASACVMAVVVGTATLLPDYTIVMMFLGSVKLKWIALVYVVFSLLGIAGPNAGGEITQLGAALIGFFYVKQLRSGHDWGNSIEKVLHPKSKLKVAYRNFPQGTTYQPQQDDIDQILDKINTSGIKSLNKHELELLERFRNDGKS